MLSYRIADSQGRNEVALIQPAGLKVFASDLGERMALIATDILGPFGQVKTSRWAPLDGFWENQCQECFGPSIAAGSTEIQKNIIAWYGLGLPRMK
jgi:alkylation response protein AidB-like acyl-CoA dehydrogenase